MNDDDRYWQLYDLIKQVKPDLTHEEIVTLVEKKLQEEK